MIPLRATTLSFWDKFYELQYKMFFNQQEKIQNHMYSSDPIEWPLTGRGIAYWVSSEHNVSRISLKNIHFLNKIQTEFRDFRDKFIYWVM